MAPYVVAFVMFPVCGLVALTFVKVLGSLDGKDGDVHGSH